MPIWYDSGNTHEQKQILARSKTTTIRFAKSVSANVRSKSVDYRPRRRSNAIFLTEHGLSELLSLIAQSESDNSLNLLT
ncbi:hypothetical protein WR25_25103 [Diploscapter pachys]|uniref:Uncharacterized protein n=1 Tax=Diploscapter pachys TaxID=2018661 RepID=A0A2A2K5B7_9BILA|nr:hypothetical protein WR25_25103 [Diploscapter pachys]